MSGIESRSELVLNPDNTTERDVWWINGVNVKSRKFGREVMYIELVMGTRFRRKWPTSTHFSAERISELSDPNLRYALRMADAANAVGSFEVDGGIHDSYGSHSVTIVATDEGFEGKLLSANYTGIGDGQNDTFIQNLHSAEHH